MFPEVTLTLPTAEDIRRMASWLDDVEVSSSWYGLEEDGLPLHIGYSPHRILQTSREELQRVFEDENRKIFSVYTSEGEHIGEGQLVIEQALLESQLFLIIGRKDLWHHHYGTIALIMLMDQAFETYGLHRVWVDVPEYNEHALQMFRHLGFVLEGHFRKSHRKDGQWYDSFAMGLLAEEYSRRRARIMSGATD